MIPDFVQQVARYEEITSSAVDFSDVLNVVEIHCTFFGGVIYEDMVACILMHDRFYAAHDVAHRFIEYRAVRGLTQCNFERHSSHQRFPISCNKLHATGLHEIKCGGFF